MTDQPETTATLRVEQFAVSVQRGTNEIVIRGTLDRSTYQPGPRRWDLIMFGPDGAEAHRSKAFDDHQDAIAAATQMAGRILDAWEPVAVHMPAYEAAVDAFRVDD